MTSISSRSSSSSLRFLSDWGVSGCVVVYRDCPLFSPRGFPRGVVGALRVGLWSASAGLTAQLLVVPRWGCGDGLVAVSARICEGEVLSSSFPNSRARGGVPPGFAGMFRLLFFAEPGRVSLVSVLEGWQSWRGSSADDECIEESSTLETMFWVFFGVFFL